MRQLQKLKKKLPLIIHDDNENIVNSPEEQANTIRNHFEKILAPNEKNYEKKIYTSCPMSIPFTTEEIADATKGMKNGKSTGIDNIKNELIKYATKEIYKEITDIFNEMANTGEIPLEIKTGILTPLQKTRKKKKLCWKPKTYCTAIYNRKNSRHMFNQTLLVETKKQDSTRPGRITTRPKHNRARFRC